MSKWLPLLGAIASIVLVGNGGYVISDGLNSTGANIGTIAQGVGSILGGLTFGGAGWYYKGGKVDTGTFDDDSQAIKHLAKTCSGCPAGAEALKVINATVLQREIDSNA